MRIRKPAQKYRPYRFKLLKLLFINFQYKIVYFVGSSTPSTSRGTSLNGDSYWPFVTSVDLHLATQSSNIDLFVSKEFSPPFSGWKFLFLISRWSCHFPLQLRRPFFTLSLWGISPRPDSYLPVPTVKSGHPFKGHVRMQWNYTSLHIYLSKSRLFMSRNDNLNIFLALPKTFIYFKVPILNPGLS